MPKVYVTVRAICRAAWFRLTNLSSWEIIFFSLIVVYTPQVLENWFWSNHPSLLWQNHDAARMPYVEMTESLLGYLENDKPDLVVAYYDEDLSWVHKVEHLFNHLYIYHKHPDKKWPKNLQITDANRVDVYYLPNVGRDNHSFLTHLIRHYEIMNRRTVFTIASVHLPGRFSTLIHRLVNQPFCWKRYPRDKLADYRFYGTPFFHRVPHKTHDDWSTIVPSRHATFSAWVEHYLAIDATRLQDVDICLWDGMFSVDADAVRSYPKSLYEDLLEPLSHASTTEDGYYMSFTWQILFPQVSLSKRPQDSPVHLKA